MNTLFGMNVYPMGLLAAGGALLCLGLMGVLGYLRRLPAGTVRVFGLLAVPLSIAGARLLFCLVNLPRFTETFENPWLMLCFFDGGLSMTGLLGGLLLAALLAAKIMKARFAQLLDVLAASLGLFLCAVYIGDGFTELGVGKVAGEGLLTQRLPWLFVYQRAGVSVEYRMAVNRYMALYCLLLFSVTLFLFLRHNRKPLRPGDLALVFFSLLGGGRVLLESLRDDGHMLLIFLRVEQLGAALLPLIALFVLARRYAAQSGGKDRRVLRSWLAALGCVGGVAVLEFALDGRLQWSQVFLGGEYAFMAVLCAVLAGLPCALCRTLNRPPYATGRMEVHLGQA